MNSSLRSALLTTMFLTTMETDKYGIPVERVRTNHRVEKKCGRPDCENTTTHNGGYCSATCCKSHREELKQERRTTNA